MQIIFIAGQLKNWEQLDEFTKDVVCASVSVAWLTYLG